MRVFIREKLLEKLLKKRAVNCGIYSCYSPDLNKIENWWSVLKTWMKQRLKEFESVRDCVDTAFHTCPNVFAYCYSNLVKGALRLMAVVFPPMVQMHSAQPDGGSSRPETDEEEEESALVALSKKVQVVDDGGL